MNVTVIEQQVHGYRQGHQLLAGSVQLSREDQSTIDRLSDIAGPLRPRERFEPYLTGYPLPSGSHYVLARTWQDLTVARAGCVRTISLIIPVADWAAAESLSPFLDLLALGRLPEEGDAKRVTLQSTSMKPLPPAAEFNGSELLEALFLEDPLPVVVFDAVSSELVATRLLTSFWPSMRQQFAVSTFALSPRTIGGRDFSLVFAPKDARSKFSDWRGRRIDGRSSQDARHRWTGTLVGRVFDAPYPKLLSSRDEGIVAEDGGSGDHAAALRIALLWDELLMKLASTPTAALGLLDIANSGKVRGSFALDALEPVLADAVRRAPSTLSQDNAWSFLGAIARKMHGRSIPRGIEAVSLAVADLAGRAPEGAVDLLSRLDDQGVGKTLLPAIAKGIGDSFSDRAQQALLSAPPEVLGILVADSGRLARRVANDAPLIDRLGEVLPQLDASIAGAVGQNLLPHLVLDWQLPAARPLLKNLDGDQLAAEIKHLGSVNDFAAPNIVDLCLQHAREIGARQTVLSALSSLTSSERRDDLLARALEPSVADAEWLLQDSGLSDVDSTRLFTVLLRQANDQQLEAILGDDRVGADAIRVAERTAPDLLRRIIFIDAFSLEVFVRVASHVFAGATDNDKVSIGERALQRCLGQHFGGDEIAFISTMLGGVGERLDGKWAVHLGLAREVRASIASRNLLVFNNAPQSARLRVISSIEDVAQLLCNRRVFDLDESAGYACAQLLLDAETVVPHAALSAAGSLLPMLMWQRKAPVSPMIVAAFPIIYRELAKRDDVPDLLRFVPFLDWDRCKAARKELVSAFMSSSWSPGHLAFTACRCSDIARILRRTAKASGGEAYLGRIASDLARVPDDCRKSVEETIASIRSDRSSKYDWSD
ncbi:hypothetical protein [Burkholderia multivorans]|uniref:GAP1-N1 domain-containing protein n=1 Tax=Burkholderia multivorans TaxID=87883 RepID=UPI001C61668D|nr:hypothetical protein [Burkholderia multivorans]